jgi:phosphoribosylaminoimidazole carboxylase PurE protein
MSDVVILMGSKSDLAQAKQIAEALAGFGLSYELRVASAHKSPAYLLQMLQQYEQEDAQTPEDSVRRVYITVAGRSNALSGFVDAAVRAPVIACPPYAEKFAGADVYSSLRMPSGVAPAVVLEPEAAALLAAKMLGRRAQVHALQTGQAARLMADDQSLRQETVL